MLSERTVHITDKKLNDFKRLNNDLLHNDDSFNKVASLSQRLRNLPIPTLSERLAAFDWQLQWDEWKWRVNQQTQNSENQIEEGNEMDVVVSANFDKPISKSLKLKTLSDRGTFNLTSDNTLRTSLHNSCKNSNNTVKSKIARPHCANLIQHDDLPSSSTESSSSSGRISRSVTPKSQLNNNNATHTTVTLLKKKLEASWRETRKSELPILPNKNLQYRTYRSLDSRQNLTHRSGSKITDTSEMLIHQREKSSTRSKIPESSFKVGQDLPYIKSWSSSDRNLARQAFESRELHLANQFQLRYQQAKTKSPRLADFPVRSIFLQENSSSKRSSRLYSSRNFMRHSLSAPTQKLHDFQSRNSDYSNGPGFYTDRPQCNQKKPSIFMAKPQIHNGKEKHESFNEIFDIPLLNIRSLSNSTDSGDTFTIPSLEEVEKSHSEPKFGGSKSLVKCNCFQISDISTENGKTSRSSQDACSDFRVKSQPKRFANSKTSIRKPQSIISNSKKSLSSSSESKSLCSDRSKNLYVPEYESKTMIIVTTSSEGLLKISSLSSQDDEQAALNQVSILDEKKSKINDPMVVQKLWPTVSKKEKRKNSEHEQALFTITDESVSNNVDNSKMKVEDLEEQIVKEDFKESKVIEDLEKLKVDANFKEPGMIEDMEEHMTNDYLKCFNDTQIQNKFSNEEMEDNSEKDSNVGELQEINEINDTEDEGSITENESIGSENKSQNIVGSLDDQHEVMSKDETEEVKKSEDIIEDYEQPISVNCISVPFGRKCRSVADLQNHAQVDCTNLRTCSTSTLKLNCLDKLNKNMEDHFPFTIQTSKMISNSQNVDRISESTTFFSEEITKHPSLVRLANIQIESKIEKSTNFLSFNPRKTRYTHRKKNFFQRLKLKFRNNKSRSDRDEKFEPACDVGESKRGKAMKTRNVNEFRNVNDENNDNYRINAKSVFNSNNVQDSEKDFEKYNDTTREDDFINEPTLFENVSSEQQLLDKEDHHFPKENYEQKLENKLTDKALIPELEIERSFANTGCLCFNWCHI